MLSEELRIRNHTHDYHNYGVVGIKVLEILFMELIMMNEELLHLNVFFMKKKVMIITGISFFIK